MDACLGEVSEMNDNDAYLLILEDNEIISGGLIRWLSDRFPRKRVLLAPSIAEAHRLFSEFPIDFFILDIMLPDGNGIDFLCDVKMVHPEAKVIMQTATPLPEYRKKASELGTICFMQKPMDMAVLEQELRRCFSGEEAPAPTPPSTVAVEATSQRGVKAILESLSLLDIVQLKCLSRCSMTLEFTRPNDERGRIYFRLGEIVHAETPKLTGPDAFATILSWQHGSVRELKNEPAPKAQTINQCWQMLLMSATQAIDEGKLLGGDGANQSAA